MRREFALRRFDMRTDDGHPDLREPAPECPTAAQLVQLLQTAYPVNWQQLLHARLGAYGITDPAELMPAKLAEFRDDVFRAAKQTAIKDPAAWIFHRAQVEPKAPVSKTGSTGQVKASAGHPKSAESEPVAQQSSPPTASAASALRSMPRTALYGTTKAEVLSRAKAGVEAGEDPRGIAGRLACAQKDFHASQRDIGRAIGRSASWVNRMLKWRRSGYEQRSPFGPTTRAGRTAHRSGGNNHSSGCAGRAQAKDDGTVKSVGVERSAPAYQAAARALLNETPTASAPTEMPPGEEAAKRAAEDIEETASVESDKQSKQQKPSANRKLRQKLSPERMRIVIDALKECPILSTAAGKAGIHRKTLASWLKCSVAGQEGYDVEWEGLPWRFHKACEAAIDQPWDRVLAVMLVRAQGSITYKVDQDLVDLGMEGEDAYARDDNGNFIEEAHTPGNDKMLKLLLQILRPEQWANPRNRRGITNGGVLVIGEPTRGSRKGWIASIKARRWKSAVRMVADKGS
jgi:hypothetical protein